MKKWILSLAFLVLLGIGGYVYVNYYSYIMSKDVTGIVTGIERVTTNSIILPSETTQREQLFSFAVAIKTYDGDIFAASADDRQWAVVQTGHCVRARFYPYPFWNLEKSGTYFNARLLKIVECPTSAAPAAPAAPVGSPAP